MEARLKALVEDRESPAEVAAWAWEFIRYDDPELYPPVDDPVVWKALDRLAGADLSASPDELLHGVEDFEQWLRELQRSTPPVP